MERKRDTQLCESALNSINNINLTFDELYQENLDYNIRVKKSKEPDINSLYRDSWEEAQESPDNIRKFYKDYLEEKDNKKIM